MKRILVTGGTGFIGKHLVRRLAENGFQVRLFARSRQTASELEGHFHDFVEGDILKPTDVGRAVEGMDVVYHLAGLVAYDSRERARMFQVNVDGTRHIIEACKTHKTQRLIHLSSVVAVGAGFDKTPLNENSPYNVAHLELGYFDSKHDAEKLVLEAARIDGLAALCLNPGTVYGHGDALKGSRKMQVKVARGELKFYPPGGVNIVHIEDVLHCLLQALTLGHVGERYIIGGENVTIRETFRLIAEAAGQKPPPYPIPSFILRAVGFIGDWMNRSGMKGPLTSENAWTASLYHWFDSTKAQQVFNYKPRPAVAAITESVEWMKTHGLLN